MTKSGIELNKFFIQLLITLVVGCWLLVVGKATAQQAPEFLVTWRAHNYVPADYQGKILPSQSSRVEVGFDLISQNRVVDLSRSNVLWFLNEQLISSGVGMKTASFQVNNNLRQTVRITVAEYEGNDLSHTFIVPVANPEVIVDTRTPTRIIRNQLWLPIANRAFEARPFFFNVANLNNLRFRWRINDQLQNPLGDISILELNLASPGAAQETSLNLNLGITNLNNEFEFGSKSINFIVQ